MNLILPTESTIYDIYNKDILYKILKINAAKKNQIILKSLKIKQTYKNVPYICKKMWNQLYLCTR